MMAYEECWSCGGKNWNPALIEKRMTVCPDCDETEQLEELQKKEL